MPMVSIPHIMPTLDDFISSYIEEHRKLNTVVLDFLKHLVTHMKNVAETQLPNGKLSLNKRSVLQSLEEINMNSIGRVPKLFHELCKLL